MACWLLTAYLSQLMGHSQGRHANNQYLLTHLSHNQVLTSLHIIQTSVTRKRQPERYSTISCHKITCYILI